MVAALLDLMLGILANFLTKLIEHSPKWLAGILHKLPQRRSSLPPARIFPADCGSTGITLAQQRLLISSSFGPYFADLLERDRPYIEIGSQINSPHLPEQQSLAPIQRVFAALQHPKGHRIILIAAEGGMGKSTLAARIVRCLYHEQAVDMILGDSAKNKAANILTGQVVKLNPEFYSVKSLVARLSAQLGVPPSSGKAANMRTRRDIQDRLAGRRAVIVVDNLESVRKSDEVIDFLRAISSRDVRIIVTSRHQAGLANTNDVLVVHLNPLTDVSEVSRFLEWHIATYCQVHPDLAKLAEDLTNRKRMRLLAGRTGGVPLMMQLLASDIARSSWQTAEQLPQLFGSSLLEFLYKERWDELSDLGRDGSSAIALLAWVAEQQVRGQKVAFDSIIDWASVRSVASIDSVLRLLFERFLILNNDTRNGRFVLFPSFVEFMQARDLLGEGG